jgi:fructokinase
MKTARPTILALGEVLWDIFPDARHLGGAPLNFAVHARSLGAAAHIVSRVGTDELGEAILRAVAGFGLPLKTVQRDPVHPTGTVKVTLDAAGVPSFEIVRDVAWDFIELTAEARALAPSADALCFGTLAQRSPQSRQSIQFLLSLAERARLIVCDINFRQTYYTREVVEASLRAANVLKLNETELPALLSLLQLAKGQAARPAVLRLVDAFDLQLVCVTLGERGAILHTGEREIRSPGYQVKVADTVGSGDAFTAGLVMKLLAGAPHDEALDYANLVGAYVASRPGATPALDADVLRQFADGRPRMRG